MFNWRWIFAITASLIFLYFCLHIATRYWPTSFWKPQQLQLEKKYRIKILLDNIELPPFFRAQKTRYRKVFPFEHSTVLKDLALDLSRYPDDFIANNLNGIVIVRSLELNGLAYGGTYDAQSNWVYIDSGWLGDDGSKGDAMGFHHEFSSLLMRQHPGSFNMKAWTAINPIDFKYNFSMSSSANLATDKLDLAGNPQTWEQGFLCSYGQLTLEDDINTFAQYYIAGKSAWPKLSRDYPALTRKMNLLKAWYRKIAYSEPKQDLINRDK